MRKRGMSGPICDPGPCEIGWHRRTNMRRCKHCGVPSQEIVDFGGRSPVVGDFRVICEGPLESDETACPIGPSDPTPHLTTAQELLVDHQRSAVEDGGCKHRAKIIQLKRN
jgi:hypothetical protein